MGTEYCGRIDKHDFQFSRTINELTVRRPRGSHSKQTANWKITFELRPHEVERNLRDDTIQCHCKAFTNLFQFVGAT